MEKAVLPQQGPIYLLELWNLTPSTFSSSPFSLLHFSLLLVIGSFPSMQKHAKDFPLVKTNEKPNPSPNNPLQLLIQFLFHTQKNKASKQTNKQNPSLLSFSELTPILFLPSETSLLRSSMISVLANIMECFKFHLGLQSVPPWNHPTSTPAMPRSSGFSPTSVTLFVKLIRWLLLIHQAAPFELCSSIFNCPLDTQVLEGQWAVGWQRDGTLVRRLL